MQDLLVTGKLLKARGLRGEIGLEPYADNLDRYRQLRTCYLENIEGQVIRELEVIAVHVAAGKIYLRFAGIDSREAAAELSNHYLSVKRSEAQSLDKSHHYLADIVGCQVEDEEHGKLGQVTEFYTQTGQNLIKVSQAGQKDLLIPFVSAFILQVYRDQGLIKVSLPEGLYDLYRG
ncbi:MAG: ribosome maturation factor RimM [Eubacteriales bacterium]|nr:ribosome maturation factor RimM [Clostridiales bacterium]MDY5836154.1 ribosome maturation factor RimM [Eubacteriales bacterium]